MINIINKNNIGIIIGLILAIVDIISFGLTKYIYLHNNLNIAWLLIPTILYGMQIWIFYYGLRSTTMTELNIIWNILSSMLVTILGIYFFTEKLDNIKIIAVLFGIVSIILFSINSN